MEKMMLGGKYVKVNGKFIWSNGWFAYDGCHKIYICESDSDIKLAMTFGYRIYPIIDLQKTYEDSCPLKFISNFSLNKKYVDQFEDVKWSYVKAPKKAIDKILSKGI